MTGRLVLGVVTMVVVQCLFGVASELLSSTPLLIAISIFGCLAAAASGGLIAKRAFVLPAAAVLLLAWLLIGYVLTHAAKSQASYFTFFTTAWPLVVASLVAAIVGAKVGEWLAARGTASSASPTT